MPTLTRLVLVLALIAAVIYGIMLALVTYVKPIQTDITIKIPAKDLNPVPLSPPVAPVSGSDEDNTPAEEKD